MSGLTAHRNSIQPAAEGPTQSSVSREAVLGLPTVVADMLLDDICPDDTTPFGAVDPRQRASPTGPDRKAPRRTEYVTPSQQGTHVEGIRSTRIVRCLRDGRNDGEFVHRRRRHRSALHSSPTGSAAEEDDETKRRKNREAAARCRQRKSERVVRLEVKAEELMEDNDELEREAAVLQSQIAEIRSSLLKHMQSGCPIRWMNQC